MAQGGQAAAVATESPEEGDSDEYLSDDEDVWWKQTWRGGTIAADGAPSGSAGRGPLSDDESEDTPEASLTLSPAAAASRRSVPRMALQSSSASALSHREKERFDLQYFYNPSIDLISVVDETFQLPNDWQRAKIDAAVARSVSKDEATANSPSATLPRSWNL
eukprot:8149864-Pyramimonas_sp.AAC.1